MSKHSFNYLALGDSYTIGEGVALFESFPCQVVQLLRKKGLTIHAPEIVAKTGWTTFELADQLLHMSLAPHYDFVTLAIGVNNQYRNLLPADYRSDFEFLIRKALHFTTEQSSRVIVLSIPDWGHTPFAHGRNRRKISEEIDLFNELNHEITSRYRCQYLDVTTPLRNFGIDESPVVADKLHPSAKAYTTWALEVADVISREAR
ncbi:SGNH/GDSL hydrolase family protein [Segetibacter sp. 3557_3]|uniref:SGNH/GDSL hydrolase family protein n=1 Tax=Segetibacter sp. 3557_3 TaxID=2547429 RepID=UPI0014052A2B|nr:SGNH/GDSL hydrolase family protein [Segetibacter sp. 3557_3]